LVKEDIPSIRIEIKHIDKMLRITNDVLRESLSSRRLNFKFINKFMKMFGSEENAALKKNTRLTKGLLHNTRKVLEGSITKLQNLVAKTFWRIQKLTKTRNSYDDTIKRLQLATKELKESKETCYSVLYTLGKKEEMKKEIVHKWKVEQMKTMQRFILIPYLKEQKAKVTKIITFLKSHCRVRTGCTFSTPKKCAKACKVVSGKAIGNKLSLKCPNKLGGLTKCPSICKFDDDDDDDDVDGDGDDDDDDHFGIEE